MPFYYSFYLCYNSKNGITKKEWFILMVHCWCHRNSVIINYFYFCSVFGFYYLLKVNNNIVLKIVVFPKNNPHIYCTSMFKQVYSLWGPHPYLQAIYFLNVFNFIYLYIATTCSCWKFNEALGYKPYRKYSTIPLKQRKTQI